MTEMEMEMSDVKPEPSAATAGEDVSLTEGLAGTDEPEESQEHVKAKAGIPGTVFNFINSIVGAGIIGLAHAVSRCGFVTGIALIILVALITDYSVRTLVAAGVKTKMCDYELVSEHTLGKAGFYINAISMFVFAYGAMVAYFIIIGDTLPQVLRLADPGGVVPFLYDRHVVQIFFGTAIILPLSLLKDMAKLAWSSTISISADVLLIIIVLIRGPSRAQELGISAATEEYSIVRPTVAAGVGAMSFAFVCQHSSFVVRNSLENPTVKRWDLTTHTALGTATFLSLCLSGGGYMIFFDHVEADILNNFGCDDWAIAVARILLAITMFFTYPMESFVARHSLFRMIWPKGGDVADHNVKYYIISFALWGSSLLIALAVKDLGIVLEFTGAVAATILGYILPMLIHIRVEGWSNLYNNGIKIWTRTSGGEDDDAPTLKDKICGFWRLFLPLFVLLFGALAFIFGIGNAFIEAITGAMEDHEGDATVSIITPCANASWANCTTTTTPATAQCEF